MVRFFSNLPDQEHLPYKFIAAEPHVKDIVGYFRPSDWAVTLGVGLGVPTFLTLWERYQPSMHPRYIPRSLAVQVPGFLAIGLYMAGCRSIQRFWGVAENEREVKRWESEGKANARSTSKGWQDHDW